jgi:CRP-like cAMP-binding protein
MAASANSGIDQDASPLELVRNCALAVELTGDQCAILAELTSTRDLADGEMLVEQGASDDRLFVITSGALEVARRSEDGGWITLHRLGTGDLAGELGFMDGRPHYAALRASGPTRVLCLTRPALESLLEREPYIVYRVMRAIFRVVHVIMTRMAVQTRELTNYIYKVGGRY